jgi:hypothetical protein
LANSAHLFASLRDRSALLTGAYIWPPEWAGARPTPHALHHAGTLSPSRLPAVLAQKMTWLRPPRAHITDSLVTMTFQLRSRLRRSAPSPGRRYAANATSLGAFSDSAMAAHRCCKSSTAAAWWRAPNARSTRWRRDASIVQLGCDAPQRRCARGTQRFNRAGNVGSPLAGAIRDTNLTGKDPAELWRFYIQLVETEAALASQ